MSPSPFRGRVGATVALHAAGMTLAWALAAALTLPVLAPLARHPDGAFALDAEGGRVLLDVLRAQASGATVAAAAAGLALLAWWAAWIVLGGTLPALAAAEPAPPLHRAASLSLARAPTLLGLALVALTGYLLAAAAAVLGSGPLLAALAKGEAPPTVSPRELVGVFAAVLIAAVVTVWHDVARAVAAARGAGVPGASAGAVGWIVRAPGATLGMAAVHAAVGALGPLAAYGAGFVWGGRSARAAVVALAVTQQLALAWRFAWRARWFYRLGAGLREGGPRASTDPPEGSAEGA